MELGRVDIACEVSMMSSCMALPRHGHLCELYNLFAYLKRYHNTEMVLIQVNQSLSMKGSLRSIGLTVFMKLGKDIYLNLFHLMHLNKEEKVFSCVSLLILIMQEMQSHVGPELVS